MGNYWAICNLQFKLSDLCDFIWQSKLFMSTFLFSWERKICNRILLNFNFKTLEDVDISTAWVWGWYILVCCDASNPHRIKLNRIERANFLHSFTCNNKHRSQSRSIILPPQSGARSRLAFRDESGRKWIKMDESGWN